MNSWLKRIGLLGIAVGEQAPFFGPILKAFIPGNREDRIIESLSHLDEIGKVVINVELISNALTTPLPGPEKLKAAAVPTAAILIEFLKSRGLKVKDEALFKEGSSDVANGIAKAFNSCE